MEQNQIEGPPWAAEAARQWLAGERQVDIAARFSVSRQRVQQIVRDNKLERPWLPMAAFEGIASLWYLKLWVRSGVVRQVEPSGLVHQTDVLIQVKALRSRRCQAPKGCRRLIDDLRDEIDLCPSCRAKKRDYPYPFLDPHAQQGRREQMQRYRRRRRAAAAATAATTPP